MLVANCLYFEFKFTFFAGASVDRGLPWYRRINHQDVQAVNQPQSLV